MDERVAALTTDDLLKPVCHALSTHNVKIDAWHINQLLGGTGSAIGGTALYCLWGKTTQQQHWSLILKVLNERPKEAVTSPYYWKREFNLYESSLLEGMPVSGIRPPRIDGCVDHGSSCWVWMEDVQFSKGTWTLPTYESVARGLGRFSGAFIAGQSIPDAPWLADHWHCQIIDDLGPTFETLADHLQQPLVQRALPADAKETILTIWQNRNRYRDVLYDMPQTLCHNDAFPQNLLNNGDEFVLIDWALAGHGAIGEELTSLVSLSLYSDPSSVRAEKLDQIVFDGYVAGLRDAGWQGSRTLARLGYTCAMTLRGLAGVAQDIRALSDEASLRTLHPHMDLDRVGELADLYASVRRFRLLRMAAEADELMKDTEVGA